MRTPTGVREQALYLAPAGTLPIASLRTGLSQHALGTPRLLDAFESRNVDVALANLAKRLHAADWCSSSRTVGCFRSLRGALVD